MWKTPVEMEVRIPTLLWALILVPMSYIGSIAVVVAYRSRDSRKKSLLAAVLILLIAISHLHWSMRKPIADERTFCTSDAGPDD